MELLMQNLMFIAPSVHLLIWSHSFYSWKFHIIFLSKFFWVFTMLTRPLWGGPQVLNVSMASDWVVCNWPGPLWPIIRVKMTSPMFIKHIVTDSSLSEMPADHGVHHSDSSGQPAYSSWESYSMAHSYWPLWIIKKTKSAYWDWEKMDTVFQMTSGAMIQFSHHTIHPW